MGIRHPLRTLPHSVIPPAHRKVKGSIGLAWDSLLILVFLLAACSSAVPAGGTEAPTPVVVRILDLAVVAPGNLLPVPLAQPTATPLLLPTATPVPATVPPSTAASLAAASPTPACTNLAEFVKHLNLSNNAALDGGRQYAKVWQIKNVGTCTWSTAYQLVFYAGDQLGSPASQPLPQVVPPGERVDLRILLTTPLEPGNYTGNWVLQDASGAVFGTGADANQPISLSFNVKAPALPTSG